MGNEDRVDRRPRRDPLNAGRRLPPRLTAAVTVVCAYPAFALAALAQPAEDPVTGIPFSTPAGIFLEPVYEGGVRKNRGIHMPVNLRSDPARRIGVGYTASNSYLNPGLLVCRDGSCELEYESDHTGNLLFVGLTQPVFGRFEIGLAIGAYQMNDIAGFSPVHQLASDRALEGFHGNILRDDSLPVLSNAPYGRQVFNMNDLDGRQLTLKPKHFYALPLRVDLTRYADIRQTGRVRMSLNAGLHLSYPLEGDLSSSAGSTAFARGIDAGLSANFIRSRSLTENLTSTFHVQVARFKSNVHVVNPRSPLAGDDNLRSQYALTYGLRFNGMFDGNAPCSIAVSQFTTSAQYDQQRYWAADPVVFDGGNNVRGALAGANDYGVLSFACAHNDRQFQVSLVEDIGGFSQLIDDDGSGTSYDPDFAVGVAVTWNLGTRQNGETR